MVVDGEERLSLPITAEEHLEEQIPVSPGGTLYLDMDRGSVSVQSHDRDEVEVLAEARGWGAHAVRFYLDRRGNDVELEVDVDRWMAPLMLGTRVRVQVWVPSVYSVEARTGGGSVRFESIGGRLMARTAGGSIRAKRVAAPAHLRTSGGSIRVEAVEGDLYAHTDGGSIRARDVAGRVDARTAGGSIELSMVDGPVEARTQGGSVRVSFIDEPEGSLRTAGGSIEVEFPANAGADLDARAAAGRIQVEHPHVVSGHQGRRKVVAKINGGGPPLVLQSAAGRIRVRATEALGGSVGAATRSR